MNKVMTTKKYIALCLLVITLGTFTKCAEEFESPSTITGSTLVDLAAADTTLQIFTAALEKTGIGISLDNISSGQHTVFAPTDSAFRVYFQPIIGGGPGDAAIVAYINTLSSSTNPTLAAFTGRLQYHVVSSEALSSQIHSSQVFTTISANRLSLSKSGSTIFINGNTGATGGKTRTLDIDGANGVIHTVNKFLTAITTASIYLNTTGLGITVDYTKSPPVVTLGATLGSNYDLFAYAINVAGLATTLRPNVAAANLPDFTVFSPDDAPMLAYLGTLSGGAVTTEANAKTYMSSLTGTPLDAFKNVVKYHIATGRVLNTDLTLNQNVPTLLTNKTFKAFAITPSVILEDALGGQSTIITANTLTNAGVLHRLNAVLKPE